MSIEVQNLRKTYGSFAAVDGVSTLFPDGQLTSLLGPSGSGKTTLLRLIAGLEQPDAGTASTIRFDGEDVTRIPIGDRRVGFVFQHYALFRHQTVFDNIAFGLSVKPRRERLAREEIRARVHELLGLIQLEGLGNRYPSQLSGGQRQRVALARALAIQPKVLLLDEPFGALDAKVREDLRRWLRRLHDELHITSIFVTHDQDEALEVSDRVVVMHKGRIEQVGTPDEVFHRPATEFVMQFLGQVNVFHGRIEDGRPVFHGEREPTGEPGARMLVRPHDLDISLTPTTPGDLPATVLRVLTAGPRVKVELLDASNHMVLVELGHDRARALGVQPHQSVYLVTRQARVYADTSHEIVDYVI